MLSTRKSTHPKMVDFCLRCLISYIHEIREEDEDTN